MHVACAEHFKRNKVVDGQIQYLFLRGDETIFLSFQIKYFFPVY